MAGKRLALLIANANYQHSELRKLNAPHSDVRALEALLKRADVGGYQTQLLIDSTKGEMERAIDRMLAKGEREDTVLIFFAGHGLKHENGKLYFAAIDTEPEYLGGTALSAGWLMEQIQNSHVGRQIVLLDCCFGGAFARGNVWRGGDRVESGRALEVPDLELEGRGQVIITSADAMQFALEGGALNGMPPASHFVRALTEGLETGEADRAPQDGKISIDELWSYLIRKLKEMGSPQRPNKWSFGSVGGDLLFAYNQRVNIATGSGAQKRAPSLKHWTAKEPVFVRLIFHPASPASRDLARDIHRQLNDDIVIPGLRIPTVFCPVTDRGQPPAQYRLDPAERNFVFPLVDDCLAVDEEWGRFVGDVFERSQSSHAGFKPIQLTPNAWPLDARLREINFARAYLHPEGAVRTACVVRRIVAELCRYLSNLEALDDKSEAPVRIFLSHAKVDINADPKVTQQLMEALREDQAIEAWFDTGDIARGSKFSEAIEKGIEHASLLVVFTDSYSTSEWCREELLLAKEMQRPIVVIDALTNHEIRSSPYLGNLPRIRWSGNPQACIDLLLKETLRHLHTTAILNQCKDPGDLILTRPPELAMLVGLNPATSVLYPDPPIGTSDARRLAKTNVHFTTPLQRLAADQSLKGKLVALSMSGSTDIDHFGLDQLHLEDAMLDLSRYLLVKGATLACGGYMGSGYSQKLFEVVRMYRDIEGMHRFERIVNHLGWPLPRLSLAKLAELNQVVRTEELPRPADVNEALHPDFVERPDFFSGDKSAEHRFAWARGMTEMRAFQSNRNRSGVVARIVLGGLFGPIITIAENGVRQEKWYSSRIPGVLEEVVLSVQAGQPVFLIGAFGGVARLVIDLLDGKPREEATWDYQKRAPFSLEMRMLYEQRGLEWLDYPEIIDLLRQKGVVGINPLLSVNEHRELFETIDVSRMFQVVLEGLNRL
jgi:hypothetical protein